MPTARPVHDPLPLEPSPADSRETARLAALHRLKLLDTPDSQTFDGVTRLTAAALNVPIVLVSLVDEKRQWFKSRVGLDATETPRAISFCAHAVTDRSPLVVPDATLDPRFAGNPMVTGAPHVRAYAGIPLYTSAGHAIGALCAIDRKPRQFTAADMNTLRDAARAIEQCIRAEEIETGPRQEDITGLEDIAGRDRIAGREDIATPSVEHPGPAHHEIIQALRRHVRRRREFEDASRRHEERLRALPGAATVYVSYWNAQLRCEFLNDAYCARFNCALEEIVGMPMPELYGAAFHAIRPYVLLALEGRDQTVARRIRLPGGQTATSMQCVPDPGAGSRIQGLYVIFAGQRRRASDA